MSARCVCLRLLLTLYPKKAPTFYPSLCYLPIPFSFLLVLNLSSSLPHTRRFPNCDDYLRQPRRAPHSPTHTLRASPRTKGIVLGVYRTMRTSPRVRNSSILAYQDLLHSSRSQHEGLEQGRGERLNFSLEKKKDIPNINTYRNGDKQPSPSTEVFQSGRESP